MDRDLSMFPVRDPQAGPNLVDLTRLYTGSLDAAHNQHVGGTITFFQNDNDLRGVPHGRTRLGEVEFDVRGVIQLRRRELDGSLYQWMWNLLPERVAGIRVGPRVRQLHVLHGVTGGAGTSDGTPIH